MIGILAPGILIGDVLIPAIRDSVALEVELSNCVYDRVSCLHNLIFRRLGQLERIDPVLNDLSHGLILSDRVVPQFLETLPRDSNV